MVLNDSKYFQIGITHKKASVRQRELVAFGPESISDALLRLAELESITEVMILSTCNRTEIYCYGERPESVVEWLSNFHNMPGGDLEESVEIRHNLEVMEQAIRVASGMDSMVLGETQIFGQLKDAVRRAEEIGTLGKYLQKLFQAAFSVAKTIRSKTEIGAHSISLAGAAVKECRRIFPNPQDLGALFIGAGDMISLCAEHFVQHRFGRTLFCNRSELNAKNLAQKYSGDFCSLANMPDRLDNFDVIISSTASPVPLIGKGMLERAIRRRKHKPFIIFDLAVPRDVEPEVAELDDVFLYSIDDLGAIVREGSDNRYLALREAEKFMEIGVSQFSSWLSSRDAMEVIKALRRYGDFIAEHELGKGVAALRRGEEPEEVLSYVINNVKNKFMDRPSRAVRDVDPVERDALVDAISRMFELGPSE